MTAFRAPIVLAAPVASTDPYDTVKALFPHLRKTYQLNELRKTFISEFKHYQLPVGPRRKEFPVTRWNNALRRITGHLCFGLPEIERTRWIKFLIGDGTDRDVEERRSRGVEAFLEWCKLGVVRNCEDDANGSSLDPSTIFSESSSTGSQVTPTAPPIPNVVLRPTKRKRLTRQSHSKEQLAALREGVVNGAPKVGKGKQACQHWQSMAQMKQEIGKMLELKRRKKNKYRQGDIGTGPEKAIVIYSSEEENEKLGGNRTGVLTEDVDETPPSRPKTIISSVSQGNSTSTASTNLLLSASIPSSLPLHLRTIPKISPSSVPRQVSPLTKPFARLPRYGHNTPSPPPFLGCPPFTQPKATQSMRFTNPQVVIPVRPTATPKKTSHPSTRTPSKAFRPNFTQPNPTHTPSTPTRKSSVRKDLSTSPLSPSVQFTSSEITLPNTPAKQISKSSGLLTPPSSVPRANRISPASASELQLVSPSPVSRQLQRETSEWSSVICPAPPVAPFKDPNLRHAEAQSENMEVECTGDSEDSDLEMLEMLEPELKMLLEGMEEEDWVVREEELSGASPAPPVVTVEQHQISIADQSPRQSSYPPDSFEMLKQDRMETCFEEMIEHLLETGIVEEVEPQPEQHLEVEGEQMEQHLEVEREQMEQIERESSFSPLRGFEEIIPFADLEGLNQSYATTVVETIEDGPKADQGGDSRTTEEDAKRVEEVIQGAQATNTEPSEYDETLKRNPTASTPAMNDLFDEILSTTRSSTKEAVASSINTSVQSLTTAPYQSCKASVSQNLDPVPCIPTPTVQAPLTCPPLRPPPPPQLSLEQQWSPCHCRLCYVPRPTPSAITIMLLITPSATPNWALRSSFTRRLGRLPLPLPSSDIKCSSIKSEPLSTLSSLQRIVEHNIQSNEIIVGLEGLLDPLSFCGETPDAQPLRTEEDVLAWVDYVTSGDDMRDGRGIPCVKVDVLERQEVGMGNSFGSI